MRLLLTFLATLTFANAQEVATTPEAIRWLLRNEKTLTDVPLPVVIEAATGQRVIPLDAAADQPAVQQISNALDRTLAILNDPGNPIHQVGRINEASRFIEDTLMLELNREPGWQAGSPPTKTGEIQRSGYPDIRLLLPNGRVFYLDPKLMTTDNRASSLRTFYYEPKTDTNKVNADAVHLLVGIHHNGKLGADLRLEAWELVDLSKISLQLKPEFQASNRDVYRPESVIRSSTKNLPTPATPK